MYKFYIIHVFNMLIYRCLVNGASNPCVESKAKSCGDCISIPGCGWCQAPSYADNPNVLISRCDMPNDLVAKGCPLNALNNPLSEIIVTSNKEHSNSGKFSVEELTQIRPQKLEIKLRPGDSVDINLSFKQTERYPVDVYFLLDLSKSMEKYLDLFKKLSQQLGQTIMQMTCDFRLGFGSFTNQTVPSKSQNPCSIQSQCVPFYSFHNDLSLTTEIEHFVDSVKNMKHSSNLDNSAGGLDAMMQAIVCQKQINWRKDATHLLILLTDTELDYADNDNKTGGNVNPNDSECYLGPTGKYYRSDEMDYPSVELLVNEINKYRIQPIFAVTKNVTETYKNLQEMIPMSIVGNLTTDFSNIIELIEGVCNNLKGQVILEVDCPKEIEVTNKIAHCLNGNVEGLKCDGMKFGNVVNFTFTVAVDICLSESMPMVVSPYGFNEKVAVTVSGQCGCECNDISVNRNCSGNGMYQCGACVCNSGFTGLDCSCVQDDIVDMVSYLENCRDPNTDLVCNSRGECQCGQCMCRQFVERRIDGRYCECDNTTCDRINGKICNSKGKCNCGVCECNQGWRGDACNCTLDITVCVDPSKNAIDGEMPCNGFGDCECGVCHCRAEYRGEFCQVSLIPQCYIHQDCIQCLTFATGKYNNTKDCERYCGKYNVTMLGDIPSSYTHECSFTDQIDDCTFQAFYEEVGGVIMAEVHPYKICRTIDFNSIFCLNLSESVNVSQILCNGNGDCERGTCICRAEYQGKFCQTSSIQQCYIHQDCIQCLAFAAGKYNDAKDCEIYCGKYNVTMLGDTSSNYTHECSFTDQIDDCTFQAFYEEVDGVIMAEVHPDKECKSYTDSAIIIIAVIASIIGGGFIIFLIWKLLAALKKTRQFNNSPNPEGEELQSLNVKEATPTVHDTMYVGGTSSGNT